MHLVQSRSTQRMPTISPTDALRQQRVLPRGHGMRLVKGNAC